MTSVDIHDKGGPCMRSYIKSVTKIMTELLWCREKLELKT